MDVVHFLSGMPRETKNAAKVLADYIKVRIIECTVLRAVVEALDDVPGDRRPLAWSKYGAKIQHLQIIESIAARKDDYIERLYMSLGGCHTSRKKTCLFYYR